MRKIFGLVALLGLFAVAATAQADITGGHRMARTTSPSTYVNIRVTMTDTKFTLSRHEGPAGSDARFTIHNVGKQPHAFQLGTHSPETGYQSGFEALVKPGETKILILYLDFRGAKVPYFGSLPADRNKKGMQGVFTVGACLPVSVQQNVGGC